MRNRVVIFGRGMLLQELKKFLAEQNVETLTMEELGSHTISAVIDVEMNSQDKKKALIASERKIPIDIPIFTSALCQTVTEIASSLQYPKRVVGFSPLLLNKMNLLEVSRPLQAQDDEEWKQYLLFWKQLGKEIELVGDAPAFVFPRILALLVNEAAFTLTEGVAVDRDIDLAMKKGTNYPLGPLEWADEIGIDNLLAILTGLQREYGEDLYRPAPLLKKMYYAGFLGRAAGKGFYNYELSCCKV